MKLKNPYSRTAAILQIIAAAVSVIFLTIATWVTTLQIPSIQDDINTEETTIKKLRHLMTKDLVQGLYAMDVHIDRSIDFLHVGLESIKAKSKSKREQLLLEEARKKTLDEIKRWDLLFRSEQANQSGTPLPFFDANTAVEQKIIKLDSALTSARRDAYSRLEAIIDQIHMHEIQKDQHQGTLGRRQTLFGFFQPIGLLALVAAVAIESHKKLKEVGENNKENDMCEQEK